MQEYGFFRAALHHEGGDHFTYAGTPGSLVTTLL